MPHRPTLSSKRKKQLVAASNGLSTVPSNWRLRNSPAMHLLANSQNRHMRDVRAFVSKLKVVSSKLDGMLVTFI